MIFIHLADLHIGKIVNGFSMLDDQKYIFKQIKEIIKKESVESVLIAGDIYDSTRPSNGAISFFGEFLTELVTIGVNIFIIRGNHDSAEQIAYCSDILEESKVYISNILNQSNKEVRRVTVNDNYGELDVYLLPYVNIQDVKNIYPDKEIKTYDDAVKTMVGSITLDKSKRNIILAHQFVTSSQLAGSEEMSIGGQENIDGAIFNDFEYTALGHIHRPQPIGNKKNIRYSGSPLKYSFSESNYKKSVTMIYMNEKGKEPTYKVIELVPLHDMCEIQGKFSKIIKNEKSEDYVHITLTDEDELPDAATRLRNIYPNLMKIDYNNKRTNADGVGIQTADIENKNELELFSEFYEMQNGQSLSEEQKNYLTNIIMNLRDNTKDGE